MEVSVALQHLGSFVWRVLTNQYGAEISSDVDFCVSLSEMVDPTVYQLHVTPSAEKGLDITFVIKEEGKKWRGIHFKEEANNKGVFFIIKNQYDAGMPIGSVYLDKKGQWLAAPGTFPLPENALRIPLFK